MLEERQPQTTRTVVLFGSYAPSLVNFRGPFIAALARRGHRIFALAPSIDKELSRRIRELGATPVEVRLGRGSLNPLNAAATVRDLRSTFAAIKPDAVIAYTITPIVLGAAVAKASGAHRFVALITGLGYAFTGGFQPKRLLSRTLAKIMYRRALRRADVAIFQNRDDLGEFQRLRVLPPDLPTEIINGSGIDVDHFSPAPLPEAPTFLMIARFLKDKGIREFGEAARRLKQDYPEVRVALAGWLDNSPDAISRAELDSILAGGVELLGKLDDVRPAIAQCSTYVLPSYREGTPRSVLEAMAMARPVITTDAPGCRETVIDGENGFLVAPRCARSLYQAMRRFVEAPELASKMGARSREIAVDKYDVDQVNRELLHYAGL
jgi:glycosyltransferase involved in cell wall biosynthesis